MPIKLYGNVGIVADGEDRPAGRARERAILAYLGTHPNGVVSADSLLDAFWEDDSDAARKSLQVRVANLRRQLENSGAALETVPGGYRLVVDLDDIDVHRFARLVAEARAVEGAERLAVLAEARAVRSEEPLVEFEYHDFATPTTRADEHAHREAAAMEAEALIAADRAEQAIEMITPIVAAHPDDERLTAALMRGLAVGGRTGEALDAFTRLNETLAERGLEPSRRLRRLEELVLLGRIGASEAFQAPPAERTLFGRAADLQLLLDLVHEHRFVTVVGPPGVGKTSLATAASHVLRRDGGSIAWVDLTAATEADLQRALALQLGVPGAGTPQALAETLEHAEPVLVVDNCEAAAEALGPYLARLLDLVPGLRALATSRVPVGTSRRVTLEPLATPSANAEPAQIEDSPAVQVFVEQARRIDARFDLSAHLEDVSDIVRTLDGLPLAIELASTRTAVLPPSAILERLTDRLTLLAGGEEAVPEHHRTLRRTIQWSVDLLGEDARRLLARLSVFRGGFSLEGAETVAGGQESGVLDALQELVAHSLVQVDPDRSRYSMLASVAEAAAELLPPEETESVDAAHRSFVSGLTAAIAGGAGVDAIKEACARLDPEGENLRIAVARCLDDRPDAAAALMADSWRWWHLRGHWTEGAGVVRRLLTYAVPVDQDLRHRLLNASVRLLVFGGDHDDLPWVLELLDEADALGADLGRPALLGVRGLALRMTGQWEAAASAHEQEVSDLRARDETARAALANLAAVRVLLGDLAGARQAALEAIDDAAAYGEDSVDTTPVTLAEIELLEGNHQAAVEIAEGWMTNARRHFLEAGFQAEALQTAAIAWLRMGKTARAAPLLDELMPLATALGGTHLGMTLLAVALGALQIGRTDVAARLSATAAEDEDLALRPQLAAIAREADAAMRRQDDVLPVGPLSRPDALRAARDVIAALSE